MRDHLGIGLAFKRASARCQLITQLFEIFDNAIVHERDLARRMGMRVARGRRAVRGPAGVGDADIAGGVIGLQLGDQIGKLALCPAADQLAILHSANARASHSRDTPSVSAHRPDGQRLAICQRYQ